MRKLQSYRYLIILSQTGLLLLLVLIAVVGVLFQGMTTRDYRKLSLLEFLRNPTYYLLAAYHISPEFAFAPLSDLTSIDNITVHCAPDCIILLSNSIDTNIAQDFSTDLLEEPMEIVEAQETVAWVVPARVLDSKLFIAKDLESVIWDQARQILLYEVRDATNDTNDKIVYIWHYPSNWNNGLLHWIDLSLPSRELIISGYDEKNGYILVEHRDRVTQELLTKSAFSVEKPSLYSLSADSFSQDFIR